MIVRLTYSNSMEELLLSVTLLDPLRTQFVRKCASDPTLMNNITAILKSHSLLVTNEREREADLLSHWSLKNYFLAHQSESSKLRDRNIFLLVEAFLLELRLVSTDSSPAEFVTLFQREEVALTPRYSSYDQDFPFLEDSDTDLGRNSKRRKKDKKKKKKKNMKKQSKKSEKQTKNEDDRRTDLLAENSTLIGWQIPENSSSSPLKRGRENAIDSVVSVKDLPSLLASRFLSFSLRYITGKYVSII